MEKELTAREKERPYSKYFYQPMAPVPKEILDFLEHGPIDAALATPIEQRNDLLKPGYLPAEMGYCIMPDGSGYVSMLTRMPGVTSEMIDWWFAWHGLEGLRYKIWDPDDHLGVHVAPQDLARRLDPGLSLRERNWNTTDIVLEDIGTGNLELAISFMSHEDFGYDMDRFRPPNVLTAVSANASLAGPGIPIVTFTHFVREIPGGIELRSRFYMGWNIINKKPVRVAEQIPLELVRGLAYHCPKEYTNLAAILPTVYSENVSRVDRIEDFNGGGAQ